MRKCYIHIVAVVALLAALPAHTDPGQPGEKSEASSPPFKQNFSILADVPESEPNNSCATAQLLGCGNTLRPASIAVSTPRDTDWIYFDANVGDIIVFGTDADGSIGQVGDTRIGLFSSNCTTLLASDDDSGPGLYSLLSICAPYTGRYYGRIAAFGTQTGTYRAFVTCTPVTAPNDRCDGGIPIQCGAINLSGNADGACNNYTLPASALSCTRFSANGKDVVYLLNVAAGDSLWLNYIRTTNDGSLYIITDCSNPAGSCVAGEDSTFSNQTETLRYKFPSAGLYYLILDSFTNNAGGPWTATGELICNIVPTRPVSWGKLKSIYR